MDDLIYFLLLIGWLAFSFYQQSVKKKKKLEKMKADQERQRREEEETPYQEEYTPAKQETPAMANEKKPDFKSVLEEILLGEQISLEHIPEKEAQSLEAIPNQATESEFDHQQKNIYQKYYDEKIEEELDTTEDEKIHKEEGIEEMVVLSENEYTNRGGDDILEGFNLRQAIIYSEILNRRYTN